MLLGFVTVWNSTGRESSCCSTTNTKVCTKKTLRIHAHSLVCLCGWTNISMGQMPVSGKAYPLLTIFTPLASGNMRHLVLTFWNNHLSGHGHLFMDWKGMCFIPFWYFNKRHKNWLFHTRNIDFPFWIFYLTTKRIRWRGGGGSLCACLCRFLYPQAEYLTHGLQWQCFTSCSWLFSVEEAFGDLHHHLSVFFRDSSLTASEVQVCYVSDPKYQTWCSVSSMWNTQGKIRHLVRTV